MSSKLDVSALKRIGSIKIFDTYYSQCFTLPDSIIYYITQNPSNPKFYQKIIQSCKYFFSKNPMLVMHCLSYVGYKWQRCKKIGYCSDTAGINLYTIPKLWITEWLTIIVHPPHPSNFASNFFSKLYKYDILTLSLNAQKVYIQELLFFTSLENLFLYKSTVISKDESTVPAEKLMECFPKICSFNYDFNDFEFATNTMKQLLKIPHFYKLYIFTLQNVSGSFDLVTFYEYFKKNKRTDVSLFFSNSISEGYRNRLNEILDKILEDETPDYKIPYIRFPGMNFEKERILRKRVSHFVSF